MNRTSPAAATSLRLLVHLVRAHRPGRGADGRGSGIRRGPQRAGHRGCRARQSPRRRADSGTQGRFRFRASTVPGPAPPSRSDPRLIRDVIRSGRVFALCPRQRDEHQRRCRMADARVTSWPSAASYLTSSARKAQSSGSSFSARRSSSNAWYSAWLSDTSNSYTSAARISNASTGSP
jgi:hypothetical protein